jgi:hypothetical protein
MCFPSDRDERLGDIVRRDARIVYRKALEYHSDPSGPYRAGVFARGRCLFSVTIVWLADGKTTSRYRLPTRAAPDPRFTGSSNNGLLARYRPAARLYDLRDRRRADATSRLLARSRVLTFTDTP